MSQLLVAQRDLCNQLLPLSLIRASVDVNFPSQGSGVFDISV